METPTHKEIIVGHPASVRLGLIKVMCKNIAESVTATEAAPNNLTCIRNIDGRTPCRQPRSRSEPSRGSSGWKGHKMSSFQDPLSRPLYQNGQRGHKMSSFQDPISRDSFEYPANLSGMYMYEMSSFQDPKWRESGLIIQLDRDDTKAKVHFKTFFQDPCIQIESKHSIMRTV